MQSFHRGPSRRNNRSIRHNHFGNRQNQNHNTSKPHSFGQKESIQSNRYVNNTSGTVFAEKPLITHAFADFNLNPVLTSNVLGHGYSTPTPIQDQAIPHALQGHDVVGIANTGTGKTAAFLLPLIHKHLANRKERTIVLCPTRELAVQIVDELKAFTRNTNITHALCIGGASMHNQIADLRRQPDFVIGTPGRMKDLIEQHALPMQQFTNVVLDEVDRMVDIGFIRDIRFMLSLVPKPHQSFFFSATMTADVASIMQQFLQDPVTISVKTQDTAETVEQNIIKVANPGDKFDKLTELLSNEEFSKVLIFGRTKWGVEKLARNLDRQGFRAASIHGNKSQNQRQNALTSFKQDKLHILVATDIAARGLDIPDVSHVINYDEPATYDDYVHRIGRTGRANKRGKALTFIN